MRRVHTKLWILFNIYRVNFFSRHPVRLRWLQRLQRRGHVRGLRPAPASGSRLRLRRQPWRGRRRSAGGRRRSGPGQPACRRLRCRCRPGQGRGWPRGPPGRRQAACVRPLEYDRSGHRAAAAAAPCRSASLVCTAVVGNCDIVNWRCPPCKTSHWDVQSPAVATQHLRPAGLGHVIPTTASARLVLPALPCGEQSKHHVTRTNEARPRDWWAERAFAPGTNPTLACALGRPRRPRFTLWAAGDGVAWLGAAIDSRRVSPPARFSLAVNAERHAIQ